MPDYGFLPIPAVRLVLIAVIPGLAAIVGCSDDRSDVLEPDETALPKFNEVILQPIDMVQIPGGSFVMGSDSGRAEEAPPHTVVLDPFRISAAEVTNGQFAEFLNSAMNAGTIRPDSLSGAVTAVVGEYRDRLVIDLNTRSAPGLRSPILYSGGRFTTAEGWEQHPVVRVTWHGATLFAEAHGMRLPTEAEWEYAARGGVGHRYATANGELNQDNAWAGRAVDHPLRTRSFSPNPFGLYDMTGNAAEWCLDWFDPDYYSRSPQANPTGPDNGFFRVVRGGTWKEGPFVMRNSYRWYELADKADEEIGFRVVKAAPGF